MQPHLCLYAKWYEQAVVLLNVKEAQAIVPITSGRVVEACVYARKYLDGKADPPRHGHTTADSSILWQSGPKFLL